MNKIFAPEKDFVSASFKSFIMRGFMVLIACLTTVFGSFAQQTQIQYLSGIDKDNTVPWDFMLTGTGRKVNVQTTIPVPSCWELMGFGVYQYGGNPNGEVGHYSHKFSVPQSWAGKKIFLVFEGVFTDTTATINGHSVGPTHQGGFYEFKYDVTDSIVPGASTNVLEVTVSKWSSSVNIARSEQQGLDYWDFGGIYRPVYLEAKPAAYIHHIAANPLADGNITVNAELGGSYNNYSLKAFVTDSTGVNLGGSFSSKVTSGATNVILSAALPTPKPWSAEFPTLYTLTVQLLDSNSAVVHSVTNQIGFRTVTFVKNQGFFINGKKVVMRGVARHEAWPTSGRTTSRAISIMDISMMKEANFNAVRMSHYPPNKVFLEECDRLGLYVLDEFDTYQHGGDQGGGGNGPMDIPNGIRLIEEMIRRDVNHPSIIAWDNGNEGGANRNLDGDNGRTTNYYGIFDIQNRMPIRPQQGGQIFNGVITDHYENYPSIANNYLKTGAQNVYMPTEMIHALYDGGGGACLAEIWELFRTATNSGGMFVWSWDDQGIRHDDTGVMDVSGQSAPDGIVGPFREKEASYYTYKAIFSPVQIGAPDPANLTGILAISNRYDFTGLNQCTFHWQLGQYPDAADSSDAFSTNALTGGLRVFVDGGNFNGPSIAAGGTGSLVLPKFPSDGNKYDALRVTATDPLGNNIYTWTWPLRTPAQIRDRIGATSRSAAITAGADASEISVTNGARVFRFSKTTGNLNGLTVSGAPVSFGNGPRPVTGGDWEVSSVTNYFDGANYVIQVNNLTDATNGFQWTLQPNGWLKLSYRFTLNGPQDVIGITFDYPGDHVTAMNWLGQGPYRVWKNRTAGQEIFGHTKMFNDTWTGQSTNYAATHGTRTKSQWVYPEFAGYHGQLYWATLQTTEQPITIVTPTSGLFLRVLTPPSTDNRNVSPAFPPGNISLLNGISAIGAKFDAAARMGPSGAMNIATGLYTGEADFFFGTPPSL